MGPSKSPGLHGTQCMPSASSRHVAAGKAVAKKQERLALYRIGLTVYLCPKNEQFFGRHSSKHVALTFKSAFGIRRKLIFQEIEQNFIKQSGSIAYIKSVSSSYFLLCFLDCGADI